MDELTVLRRAQEGFGARYPEPPLAMDERVMAQIRGGHGPGRAGARRPGRFDGHRRWIVPALAVAAAGSLVFGGVIPLRPGGSGGRRR